MSQSPRRIFRRKRETLKRKTIWNQNCFAVTFPRGKVKCYFSYFCKHKYKIFICCLIKRVTKFVCKEIWQKNHFTFLQEKESKLCLCHVTNIYTERKNKSIILHSFARKKYHITPRSSKLSRKRFLAAFVILIEESFYLIVRKGK